MTELTPSLGLPRLAPAQARKHVIVNEALMRLDALVQLTVLGHLKASPTSVPQEGDRYIVPIGSTGDWSGLDRHVVVWQGNGWLEVEPFAGWLAWSEELPGYLRYDGSAWSPLSDEAPDSLPAFGINTPADAQNPLSVRGDGSLLSAETADHRLSISKTATSDVASLVLQSGFSGRAEVGLVGDDRLKLRVSSDGTNWSDALDIAPGGPTVGVGTVSGEALTISSGQVGFGYNSFTADEHDASPAFSLMAKASGNRNCFFDLQACDDFTNYSSRIVRFGGANSPLMIANRGVGGITIRGQDGGAITLDTQSVPRLHIHASGRVGIGTTTPSTALDVAGPVRVGRYDSASLPDPSTAGEGSIAYALDAPLGPGLVVSDGQSWGPV